MKQINPSRARCIVGKCQRKQTLLSCYCPFVCSDWLYEYIFNNTDNLSELSFGSYLLILLVLSLTFSVRNINYVVVEEG